MSVVMVWHRWQAVVTQPQPHAQDQRGASVEALVDLLKHPACVGLMREAVLRELGRQHERSFRSVRDAVAWSRQHRPDIDLTSPPRRDPQPGR